MLEVIFLIVLGLIWIGVASWCDLKTREVPNWLNFSLIIFALGFRFFYSVFQEGNFNFFYQGLIFFGVFLVLGNLFYYSRMFAGGDAKLMIALGAVLPFTSDFITNVKIGGWFLVLFLGYAMVYGVGWGLVLMIKNFGKFKKEFWRLIIKNCKIFCTFCFIGVVVLFFGVYDPLFFVLGGLIFILPNLYVFGKAIENVCMIKKIPVSKLTEGDWLLKDVKVSEGVVKSSWEGLDFKEIELLKKYKKEVYVKEGIPFVPVFLLAFVNLVVFYFLGFTEFFLI